MEPIKILLSGLDTSAVIFKRDGVLLWANPYYERRFGKTETPGFIRWMGEYNPSQLIPFWDCLFNNKNWHGEVNEKSKERWVEHDTIVSPIEEGVFLAILTDVSQLKMAIINATARATRDGLTGISNRAHFEIVFDLHIKHARRHKDVNALLLIDLDGFKSVNDTYGHDVGDEVLKVAAERLQESVREVDFCARLGGDEFCCILGQLSQTADAGKVASKIIQSLSEPIRTSAGEIKIGASAGVAIFGGGATTTEKLFKVADERLYAAKRAGKNTWRDGKVAVFEECEEQEEVDRARKARGLSEVHGRVDFAG